MRSVVATMVLPSTRYPDGPRQIALYNRLLESLSQRAELEAAGLGFPGPLKANNASGTLMIEGWPASPKDRPFSHISSVSGGFFEAMGIPLTAGRTFTDRDRADAPGVHGAVYQQGAERARAGRRRWDRDGGVQRAVERRGAAARHGPR